MNSTQAINKLVDYVRYESDYSPADIKRMLVSLKTIVYLEDFKVKEISEIKGIENEELVYERIF